MKSEKKLTTDFIQFVSLKTMSALSNTLAHLKDSIQQAIAEGEYPEAYEKEDIIHAEVDYIVSTMYQSEVNECLCDYGLDKALELYEDEFGDIGYIKMTSARLLYTVFYRLLQE